jgi:hypothetical protein
MSGLLGLGVLAASGLASVLLRRSRSIGDIIPGVVIEETQIDQLAITEHPVEIGAPVSDHAYRRPAEVIMKCGWSNSSPLTIGGFSIPFISQGLASSVMSLGEKDFVTETYAMLQKLQASREPFNVTTGKRLYKNMLIESLAVTTDETTENALMVVCKMREVIIVVAVTRSTPSEEQQAAPEETQGTAENGPASSEPSSPPPNSGPTPQAAPSTAQATPGQQSAGFSQGPPASGAGADWTSPTGSRNAAGVPN